jgi:hypothetical protein
MLPGRLAKRWETWTFPNPVPQSCEWAMEINFLLQELPSKMAFSRN